jgi:starch synthase
MTKVLMVASEAAPFAKTGGLADVVGALSPTLARHGEEVAVLMPRYRGVSLAGLPCVYDDLKVWFGPAAYDCRVFRAIHRDVAYYLLDCPTLYDRDYLYGEPPFDYPDNDVRFAVLSRVALRIMRHVFRPQIVHCHDWQASLAPVYMRSQFDADPTFLGLKTVLTIHNLGYQGLFPPAALTRVGLGDGLFSSGRLEFFGQVNLLKGGIVFADAVTTVSKTYAHEIQTQEYGFGLEGVLRSRAGVLTGILNGVDYTVWDPATDSHIAAHYSPDDLSGKRECKRDLLAQVGLAQDNLERPLIGIVSRFAAQKGFDLIQEIAPELMAEDVSLVALGSGDAVYEDLFRNLASSYPDKVAVRIAYDDDLAHKIEAGADMFLMPSRYEPCGLSQIYSLKYGAVPVVRATGGLDDTIEEGIDGFKLHPYSGPALLKTLRAALATYQNREKWTALMLAGMRKDFSWNASAQEYSALYRRLAG